MWLCMWLRIDSSCGWESFFVAAAPPASEEIHKVAHNYEQDIVRQIGTEATHASGLTFVFIHWPFVDHVIDFHPFEDTDPDQFPRLGRWIGCSKAFIEVVLVFRGGC